MLSVAIALLLVAAGGVLVAAWVPQGEPDTDPGSVAGPAPPTIPHQPIPVPGSIGEPDPQPAPRAVTEPAPPPPPTQADPPGTVETPGFTGTARALPPDVRKAMTGVSWRPDCPVALDDLVLLEVAHWGFDGHPHTGHLVVAAGVADPVLDVFSRLFAAEFPIERMELVDAYGGDDRRSMAANNTHAFNCRPVEGTHRWSQHTFGSAIDMNPVQNPHVRGAEVSPPAGAAYVDRSDVRPGMITRSGPVVDAFTAIGWGWGGDWRTAKDYQHFSESGR